MLLPMHGAPALSSGHRASSQASPVACSGSCIDLFSTPFPGGSRLKEGGSLDTLMSVLASRWASKFALLTL